MKNVFIAVAVAAFGLMLNSCSVNDPLVFDDAFVFIEDENGTSSSKVQWQSQNYLVTYYIRFVAPAQSKDVTVTYELKVGDGLSEGKDYRIVSSSSSPVTFSPGIYKVPIRIEWLRNELDASKDNSLTIILTGCSLNGSSVGKPGPDKAGSSYKITKE